MQAKILIIAFGNPGRQDDGLGPRCAELLKQRIAGRNPPLKAIIEINYQLTVEDALLVSEADRVIFVDAIKSLEKSFLFAPIEATEEPEWNYHLLSPQNLLYLTTMLFNKSPQAFIMAIKGYQFDQFREMLSVKAKNNMHQACQFLLERLEEWSEPGQFQR